MTSFKRKRVALSNTISIDFDAPTPWTSALEDLPQEILIRIMCGVEHEDLESLLLASKTMRDAAVIAKQTHFAYNTPTKRVNKFEQVETPQAPKLHHSSCRRLSFKKLVGISVCLFASHQSHEQVEGYQIS
ncbi:F-box protein At1g61340-like [Salvia splendens]|uniref:F-box protein At1g61340-like n=1 Tax=Salvia splendens TaxID=180675 RepID=UPI001C257C55|nr:F-box protein At1g61340-like [Salvia splendens]